MNTENIYNKPDAMFIAFIDDTYQYIMREVLYEIRAKIMSTYLQAQVQMAIPYMPLIPYSPCKQIVIRAVKICVHETL